MSIKKEKIDKGIRDIIIELFEDQKKAIYNDIEKMANYFSENQNKKEKLK